MENPNFYSHMHSLNQKVHQTGIDDNALEAAMDTKAKKVDGGWVINRCKHYISNGYDASLYIIYANTNPSVGMMDGTSSFIV